MSIKIIDKLARKDDVTGQHRKPICGIDQVEGLEDALTNGYKVPANDGDTPAQAPANNLNVENGIGDNAIQQKGGSKATNYGAAFCLGQAFDGSFAVGYNATGRDGGVAIGDNSQSGNAAIAVGRYAKARRDNSIALGYKAVARFENDFATTAGGDFSDATFTRNRRYANGRILGPDFYGKSLIANVASYFDGYDEQTMQATSTLYSITFYEPHTGATAYARFRIITSSTGNDNDSIRNLLVIDEINGIQTKLPRNQASLTNVVSATLVYAPSDTFQPVVNIEANSISATVALVNQYQSPNVILYNAEIEELVIMSTANYPTRLVPKQLPNDVATYTTITGFRWANEAGEGLTSTNNNRYFLQVTDSGGHVYYVTDTINDELAPYSSGGLLGGSRNLPNYPNNHFGQYIGLHFTDLAQAGYVVTSSQPFVSDQINS